MIILAIDTCGTSGSVALLRDDCLLRETKLDPSRRTAQTLAPAMHDLLAQAKIPCGQVELVATTVGPGSFTGLRIGVTAAKSFAYATGAAVIGLSSLEVLAASLPPEIALPGQRVQAVLDAQRSELFVGEFRVATYEAGDPSLPRMERIAPDRLQTIADWRSELSSEVLVTGPGLKRVSGGQIAARIAEEKYWEPRASVVGREASRCYQRGRRDNLWKLAPLYLRSSYAEEKAGLG